MRVSCETVNVLQQNYFDKSKIFLSTLSLESGILPGAVNFCGAKTSTRMVFGLKC